MRLTVTQHSHTDLCPRESVRAWLHEFGQQFPSVPFHSASAFTPVQPQTPSTSQGSMDDALGVDAFISVLETLVKGKATDEPVTVAFVGLSNVCLPSIVAILTLTLPGGWLRLARALS